MSRLTVVMVSLALVGGAATQVDAQGRRATQAGRSRNDVARAQGIPPGQLPAANMCRVWYDNRPNGRQPSATNCVEAERIAARDRNARVIYGEDVYDQYGYRAGNGNMRYPETAGGNDRGVYRVPGRNRDPRVAGGVLNPRGNDPYNNRSRYTTPGFQNGYRDGLDKGREDAEDNDRYDVNRHSWYKSATRGYENEFGTRASYQAQYREGFEVAYAEAYRAYARR